MIILANSNTHSFNAIAINDYCDFTKSSPHEDLLYSKHKKTLSLSWQGFFIKESLLI
ncbi:MAG: hypothetical protein ACJAVX_001416 [Pseudoalteromonas rhizosphaerae]|jgi:hypothetical protein|tara:strand:- start:5271 stop:5441 length:171 start_codon:yes stop_codon:yes gene_type:complete